MSQYREVSIKKIKPGMRVARMVENKFGAMLVSPGMILDDNLIKKLKRTGIEKLAIYNDPDEQLEKNRYSFSEEYRENIKDVKNIFNSIHDGNKLDFAQIKEVADKTREIDTNRDIVTMLSTIRDADEYTYTHSVNVGLLAMLFGRWSGLNPINIRQLLYAGLLHDIGKARIPDEILNKRGRLNEDEFEVIKKHTSYGYELAKECKFVSEKIARAVLMHHERNDSSGYPFGHPKEKIPFMARVLAIVDTYDAMTSDRVYRGHRPPFAVFKLFEEDLHSFDLLFSKIFMNNMSQYYLGEMVDLTNGAMGEIVYINPKYISQPIVKVGDKYIDLSDSETQIRDVYVKGQHDAYINELQSG